MSGVLSSLAAADARVSERIHRAAMRLPQTRWVAALIAHTADWWWWLIGAAAAWLAGGAWLAGDAHVRRPIVVVVATIVLTAVTVQSLKWIVRRERPPGERDFLSHHTDPHSFPSGHAARAVALTIVGAFLGPWWLAAALAPWAALVAGTRVVLAVHHLSDVIVGIAVGIVCGLAVVAWATSGAA